MNRRLAHLAAAGHLLTADGDPDDTGGGDGDKGGGGDKAKTFTQDEVNGFIKQRAERVAAEKYGDYTDLQAKAKRLDEIEAANASDLEKAVKAAEDKTRAEVTGQVMQERVLDKIEVAAAGKFADVEDARLRLGRKAEQFIKDGSIDAKAIAAEVEEELKRAPHLRVPDGKAARPKPDHSQGSKDGDRKSGSVAQVMADRAAARAARNPNPSS